MDAFDLRVDLVFYAFEVVVRHQTKQSILVGYLELVSLRGQLRLLKAYSVFPVLKS